MGIVLIYGAAVQNKHSGVDKHSSEEHKCHSDGYYGFGSAVTKVLAKKKASYELMLNMLEGAGMDTHKWRVALQ